MGISYLAVCIHIHLQKNKNEISCTFYMRKESKDEISKNYFSLMGNQLRLKPSQNKKGQKNFQLHRFLNTFSQLPAVKKYSKNGAAENLLALLILTRL